MKKEFDIEDEWVSFEIHPETPPEGESLAERFGGMNLEGMFDNLRRSGAPYGIEFGELQLLSNSQKALEASEFARDMGKHHEIHEAIFHAYFTELKDIGDLDVLMDVAAKVGLDPKALREVLADGRYVARLEQAQVEGARYGVTGTPTFIINNRYKVVGAQPLDSFRHILQQIESEMSAQEE